MAAGVVFLALLASAMLTPWQRVPRWTQVLPLLACLCVVALLRHAEGGAASPESGLALVPVIWCALYGTRRQLGVLIAAMALMFIVPRLAVGGRDYPITEWERTVLFASGLIEADGSESIEDVLVRADAVLYASKTNRTRAPGLSQSAT